MAYEVHLKEFDGPLDLLLHLIEQAKVDIKDIFVSQITNQYLALMEELDGLDMDTASEFLTVAATLVFIKSRSLLPRPPKEEPDEEDPEAVLLRQLRDYKLFKQAGQALDELHTQMNGVFFRFPEEILLPPQEYTLSDATCAELFEAFYAILNRVEPESNIPQLAQRVEADRFTVREQLSHIRKLLSEKNKLDFDSLFEPGAPKLEKIVTFMALLEMIARQEIFLRQSGPYQPITLTAANLRSDDENEEYMDELD